MKTKFLLGVLLVFCFAYVSAAPEFDYGMIKWSLCNQYNLTEYNCDAWWENENNPFYVDDTTDMEGYYNKTQVEGLFNSYYDQNQTKILVESGIWKDNEVIYNRTQVDNLINSLKRDWLQNMSERYVEKDEYEDDLHDLENSDSGIDSNTIIILVVAVLGFVGFLIFQNKKSQLEKKKTTGTSHEDELLRRAKEKLAEERRMTQYGAIPQQYPQQPMIPQQAPIPQQNPVSYPAPQPQIPTQPLPNMAPNHKGGQE